mgnify:CR=1 FL=1
MPHHPRQRAAPHGRRGRGFRAVQETCFGIDDRARGVLGRVPRPEEARAVLALEADRTARELRRSQRHRLTLSCVDHHGDDRLAVRGDGDHIVLRGQPFEHLAVDRRRKAAHGESGVHRLAQRQVVGAPRSLVLRLEPLGGLVEVGVLAVGGVLVVVAEGLLQRPGRQVETRLHLGDGLPAVDERAEREVGVLDVGRVHDQVCRRVRLLQDERRGAGVVGVLGHEPLTALVDDQSRHQHRRRVERRGDERLVHVLQRRADRLAEPDAQPVVVRRTEREGDRLQARCVALDHVRVVDEATRRDHDAASPHHHAGSRVIREGEIVYCPAGTPHSPR